MSCEGAWDLDDKVESMWAHYLYKYHLENGNTASDSYHHFEEDIQVLKEEG